MEEQLKTERKIFRVRGRLKELVVVRDSQGNIIQKVLSPLMVEFKWIKLIFTRRTAVTLKTTTISTVL